MKSLGIYDYCECDILYIDNIKPLQSNSTGKKLCKIGSLVKIEISELQDELPIDLYEAIKENPTGEVIDYKMTDGTGIGVVVKLENGQETWFFNEELSNNDQNTRDSKEINYYDYNSLKINKNLIKKYQPSKEIKKLVNPIIFFNWFIYSSKDII